MNPMLEVLGNHPQPMSIEDLDRAIVQAIGRGPEVSPACGGYGATAPSALNPGRGRASFKAASES